MRPLPNGRDVEVVNRDVLDNPERFDWPWLVIYPNGWIDYCDTEDEACAVQREWREASGLDPMTGEAKPSATHGA